MKDISEFNKQASIVALTVIICGLIIINFIAAYDGTYYEVLNTGLSSYDDTVLDSITYGRVVPTVTLNQIFDLSRTQKAILPNKMMIIEETK